MLSVEILLLWFRYTKRFNLIFDLKRWFENEVGLLWDFLWFDCCWCSLLFLFDRAELPWPNKKNEETFWAVEILVGLVDLADVSMCRVVVVKLIEVMLLKRVVIFTQLVVSAVDDAKQHSVPVEIFFVDLQRWSLVVVVLEL